MLEKQKKNYKISYILDLISFCVLFASLGIFGILSILKGDKFLIVGIIMLVLLLVICFVFVMYFKRVKNNNK